MSRSDRDRLLDVLAAVEAIARHTQRGSLDDGLVFDAVRVRLIEIGEALKDVDPSLLHAEPSIPWRAITGMRDVLAHRYFDTAHDVIASTVAHDLPVLAAAVQRLLADLEGDSAR